MDNHAFHRRQACRYMFGIGVRMQDVLTLHIQRLEHAIDSGVEHIGNTQAGFGIKRDAPVIFKQPPRIAVTDMAIAR